MRCSASARTSAVRRAGSAPRTSSSVPATGRGTRRTASTSKARRPDRSSGGRSRSATTASSSSTRRSATATSWASGTIRTRTQSSPELERARSREAQDIAGRHRHQQLRVAIDLPPRLRGHPAQPRPSSQRQRLAALASFEDAPPREFNWVVGVNLLTLTLLLSFTGYLLPWDQLAIWAVTVGTNMARATPLLGTEGPFGPQLGMTPRYDARALLTAGTVVGAPTLLRFYVLHCIFIPIIASILMILHFWRIRKDGGISGPL